MTFTHRLRSLIAILSLVCVATATLAEQNWPEFRGPGGRGHATCTGLPLTWSESENVTWKTLLPGRGWSSPVIEGNDIWMTTGIDIAASPEEKELRLKTNTGSQPLNVAEKVDLRALCVDLQNGRLKHDVALMTESKPQWIHTLNSYASPTPVIENGRLYCHFGVYGTACLDTKTGNPVWVNRELRVMHENGPGSSPILVGDVLVFHCDGSDEQYIVGLDKHTGRAVWKTRRSGKMHDDPQLRKSYATPTVVEIDGKPQVISPAANWLYAYAPQTGQELWKINYGVLGFSNVPRPVVGHGMIYTPTSFMKSELLAIRYEVEGRRVEPEIVWRFGRQAPQKPSPLLVGDEIYIVSDKGGVAACLDAKTGELLWQERLGGNYSSSPLYADSRVYFSSHDGDTHVVQAGREYQHLATNQLDGSLMASPAVADGAFLIRSDKALYRIESKPAG